MENSIVAICKSYEQKIGGKFSPDENTYRKTGINPKRLGMLLSGKNKTTPTIKEAVALSQLFGVSVEELM